MSTPTFFRTGLLLATLAAISETAAASDIMWQVSTGYMAAMGMATSTAQGRSRTTNITRPMIVVVSFDAGVSGIRFFGDGAWSLSSSGTGGLNLTIWSLGIRSYLLEEFAGVLNETTVATGTRRIWEPYAAVSVGTATHSIVARDKDGLLYKASPTSLGGAIAGGVDFPLSFIPGVQKERFSDWIGPVGYIEGRFILQTFSTSQPTLEALLGGVGLGVRMRF